MVKRIGLLLLVVVLLVPGSGSFAQDNSAQKQKILADLHQAVTRLNGVQTGRLKPETAYADGIKTLASIQQYETDPLFVGSKELTDLYYDEFQTLYDLGLSGETIQTAIVSQLGQGVNRPKEQRTADEQQITDSENYLLKAIDRMKDLTDQQTRTLLPRVYIELALNYRNAGVYIVGDHGGDNSDPTVRQLIQDNAFQSQDTFGKAADAAKAAGMVSLQAAAYDAQSTIMFDLATNDVTDHQEDAHGKSAGQWYAQAIVAVNAAVALQPSNGAYLSDLAADLDFYGLRIDLGVLTHREGNARVPDDASNLDALLSEQIQVENRLLQLPATTTDPQNLAFSLWSRGEASILLALRTNNIALARAAASDLAGSIPAIQQLVTRYPYYGNYPLIAQTLLGRALVFIGERPDLALNALQRADAIAMQSNTDLAIYFDWDQGLKQQNELLEADALSQLGRYDEAIAAYKDVLTKTKPSADLIPGHSVRGLSPELVYSDALDSLSQTYQKEGRYDQALDPLRQRRTYFEGRLQKLQAQSSPDATLLNATQYGITDTLIKISIPLVVVGSSEEALTGLQHALDIAPSLNDPVLVVDTQLRIADIYLQLNLKKDAADLYSKAAVVADKGNLPQQRGHALLGLGSLQSDGGLLTDAQTTLTQAEQSAQTANDTETQIRALIALGDLMLKGPKPNPTTAGKNYGQALDLANHAQDTRLSLDPLLALGDLQAHTGDRLTASVTYYRALAGALAIGSRENIARVLGRIGGLEGGVQGRAPLALQAYSDAINQVEQTQRGYQSSSLKTQFAANYAGIYGDYMNLLFQQKQYEPAFDVAERARARAFLDQLATGPLDLRAGASADLLTQEAALRQQIDAAQGVLVNAQNDPASDAKLVARLQTNLQNAEDVYAKVFTRMQAENPVLSTLTGVQTASLSQVQAILDPSTTVLEFYTTDQQSFAFIVTAHSFTAVALPVTQSQLADAVALFRADEKQAGGLTTLSASLITPIISQLQTKHLLIVPHNILNYLPFAALPLDNGTLLGDQFAIRYIPSATALVYLPNQPQQPGSLLALGNPAADGQRPLPFAEAEVKGVSQIAGGDVYTGAGATKALFLQRAPQAGVVYVAAHSTLNPLNPLFSGLELAPNNGQSGRLEANEIYGLDLTEHTSLVVLSACETALGDLSAGDEFTGINRAFLYAGAPAVIATLWSIDDKATALLMQDFFKARTLGQSNSEALQSAQQALRTFKDDQGQTPYAQPYYWAAFILTGRD